MLYERKPTARAYLASYREPRQMKTSFPARVVYRLGARAALHPHISSRLPGRHTNSMRKLYVPDRLNARPLAQCPIQLRQRIYQSLRETSRVSADSRAGAQVDHSRGWRAAQGTRTDSDAVNFNPSAMIRSSDLPG